MSPRRSSRARSSANPPPIPSQDSSNKSANSIKNTRSAQHSESSEGSTIPDDDLPIDPVMPRRSRRNGTEDNKDPSQPKTKEEDIYDEEQDQGDETAEEEVTRCICGMAEYPGPSNWVRDLAKANDVLSEDLGNFFVQCDKCLVWQHGGCMGFTDEANLPEEYYCELCKPELHKVMRGSSGPKSSRYLPVMPGSSRSSSLSSSEQRKKDNKNKHIEPAKRRATMNSRGAYDEDEMLRRAIEESKEMGALGKRARCDADDPKQNSKRQRTAASPSSNESKGSQSPPAHEEVTKGGRGKQNLRGAAVKNTKERELREKAKEQAAAARAEAANKRNTRSERRRGEDSPPPTPSMSPSKAATTTAVPRKQDKADTPPVPSVKSRLKAARPARRGRLGRNQYTRDLPNGADSDTPMRDTSLDRNGVNGSGNSPTGANGVTGESGRSSKAKTHPARTSMNEMKRRVAAILEFVGQLQEKRDKHKSGSRSRNSENGTPNGTSMNLLSGLAKAVQAASDVVEAEGLGAEDAEVNGRVKMKPDEDFRGLASTEMMEALTRELMGWQQVYGVYSR